MRQLLCATHDRRYLAIGSADRDRICSRKRLKSKTGSSGRVLLLPFSAIAPSALFSSSSSTFSVSRSRSLPLLLAAAPAIAVRNPPFSREGELPGCGVPSPLGAGDGLADERKTDAIEASGLARPDGPGCAGLCIDAVSVVPEPGAFAGSAVPTSGRGSGGGELEDWGRSRVGVPLKLRSMLPKLKPLPPDGLAP
jgi:hypothetical protein